MSVPVPHTWTAGDDATSANMQSLTDTGLWNLGSATSTGATKTLMSLRQTTAQAIPTTTWTALTFTTEDADYDGGHSTVTNTSRFTATVPGFYLCMGGVVYTAITTGFRMGTCWAISGTLANACEVWTPTLTGSVIAVPARTQLLYLNAGSYLELMTYQNSAGSVNTSVNSSAQSSFCAMWVSN